MTRLPTLAERFSPTSNSFGLLRVGFALGVLLAHCWPLGFGLPSPGDSLSRHQTDIGTSSLQGFLFLSGFFIAASGLRYDVPGFLWRRCLRLLPALWVCLAVTAFGFAPLVALHENGSLAGFWTHPDGPFSYVYRNLLAAMDQYTISGLLSGTPWGVLNHGPAAFDGSLWTLRYEIGCYAVVMILMAFGLLKKAPAVVLGIVALGYAMILFDLVRAGSWTVRPGWFGGIGPIPLFGDYAGTWVLYLGFYFVLGAAARLYMHRIPMHGALALGALVVIVVTMFTGGYLALGVPSLGYLVLYLAVALPEPLTRIAHKRDFSYGIYIYAFPVQQVLALLDVQRFGMPVFVLATLAGTLAFAVPSWYLVEAPALRLKDRWVGRPRERDREPAVAVAG